MPTKKETADTAGKTLWNEHIHKKAVLTGVQINNKSEYNEDLSFRDCFLAMSSKACSGGGAIAPEYLGVSGFASGLVKLEVSVPAGEFVSLGEEDLKNCEFIGKGAVIGSATTSDCVVVAQYQLR